MKSSVGCLIRIGERQAGMLLTTIPNRIQSLIAAANMSDVDSAADNLVQELSEYLLLP